MKFSVLSGELLKTLTKASSVIPIKSALPILENYLFEVENDNLSISATDLEISVLSKMIVKGKEDGKIVIPAKKLDEIIRALPVDIELNFNIDTDAKKILIKTDQAEYKLTGQDTEDYPQFPEIIDEKKILIDSKLLQKLINKTLFAASKDDLRPVLTGILFHLLKNEIRVVSTDGHRLVKVVNKNFECDEEKELVLPNKALNIVTKYIDENFQYIAVDQTQAKFVFENSIIRTKLIEEKYPNYESVIPTESNYTMSINKNELLSSVTRAAIFTNNPNNLIKFSIDNGELVVSAEDTDYGMSAIEKLKCEFDYSKFEIGFNAAYVIDILNHLDSDEVSFFLTSPNRAATVMPKVKDEDEDILMLLMPLRLN
ncbi:MAG: DNA polymerase III beta subunit [Ignavibacteriae bacterium]|nr:MAG: DNA polymerase III beta subunit [Ignavibacteriota bacterium]